MSIRKFPKILIMKNNFTASFIAIVLLTLLVFSILHWTDLPIGSFWDWVIGLASFWWLMLITTVPWNLHFKAKEILSDARESEETGITVEGIDIQYAQKISKTYLYVALFLHLASGVGLYSLAVNGISVIGYIGAVLALLLTALRPSVRLYEYLNYRLTQIGSRIKYPREDILVIKQKLEAFQQKFNSLGEKLDEENPTSWASRKVLHIDALQEETRTLRREFERLHTQTHAQSQEILKQTEQKIALLSEDAQFLNQARQLVRFIKEA